MRNFLVVLGVVLSAAVFAQSPAFQRGQIVRLSEKFQADEGGIRDLRVIAIPGDHLYVDRINLAVNGVAVEGLNPEFTNALPASLLVVDRTVPDGHVVVVGELNEQKNGVLHAGRYWALTGAKNLILTR